MDNEFPLRKILTQKKKFLRYRYYGTMFYFNFLSIPLSTLQYLAFLVILCHHRSSANIKFVTNSKIESFNERAFILLFDLECQLSFSMLNAYLFRNPAKAWPNDLV